MQRITIILLATLGLLVAGCSSDGDSTETGGQLASQTESGTEDGADQDTDAQDGADQDGADQDGADQDGADDDAGSGGAADEPADDDKTDSAVETLRSAVLGRALGVSGEGDSGRFEGVITITGQPGSELPGEIELLFDGSFDAAAAAAQVTMDFGDLFTAMAESDPEAAEGMELFGSLFEEPMEVITIGEKSWVKWGLLSIFGVEDKWLESDAESGAAATDMGFGGGNSPNELLEQLADADANIEDLGQETIRGIETTHYRADLDISAFAADLSAADRADFEASLGASTEGSYVIELWVGDDDLLHRMTLIISDLPAAEADGLDQMEMVYDLFDHGLDPGIVQPPADQIVTEEEIGLSLEDLGSLTG